MDTTGGRIISQNVDIIPEDIGDIFSTSSYGSTLITGSWASFEITEVPEPQFVSLGLLGLLGIGRKRITSRHSQQWIIGGTEMYRCLILAFSVFVGSASANAINITASERGWVCDGVSGCPNNGASPSNNYAVGVLTDEGMIRDWFEFAIPTLTGGSLVAATLDLDEPSPGGHLGGTFTFAVYGLGAQPLVFSDVTTSNPFGSVSTTSASEGTTVAITLDAAALAAIAAAQTGNIFIGGVDSAENSSSEAGDFLGTVAGDVTSLSLTTGTAVPEPSSLPLLLFASAAVLVGLRRKTRGHGVTVNRV
jgi:hypothetical protein